MISIILNVFYGPGCGLLVAAVWELKRSVCPAALGWSGHVQRVDGAVGFGCVLTGFLLADASVSDGWVSRPHV